MINFFRKIRKQLANENKFQKYFRYAFGEVTLIMIGIFMALQLNNWNENRKQDAQFKITLEQLYNSIMFDTEKLEGAINNYSGTVELIDVLLNQYDSIPYQEIPHALYGLVMPNGNEIGSESSFHAGNLNYNPNNKVQNEITKFVINYVDNANVDFSDQDDDILNAFKNIDLHWPKVDKSNINGGWIKTDSTYYSNDDLDNYWELLKSNSFRSLLKSLRTSYLYAKAITYVNHGDGISILKLIKNYHPEAKILFQDVGIIGTSLNGFDEEGGTNTPMIQTDMDKNIWELEAYLKVGEVKFRCRDSWAQNWGGGTFPTGEAFSHGGNIPVTEAGNYHIILDLSKNTYEFIKLADN